MSISCTKIYKVTDIFRDSRILDDAAALLRQGRLVAFPTETVYGLGAYAFDPDACAQIYAAKNRPMDNPLIVHINATDELSLVADLNKLEYGLQAKLDILANRFWPGPLTLILPKAPQVSSVVTCGLSTVAVRIPSNEIARELIKRVGPIAAPSANSSGKPSPTTAMHVYEDISDKVGMIIDGGRCGIGLESTILDLTCDPPAILRPGYVTHEDLTGVLGAISDSSGSAPSHDAAPKAPGMKYTHYSPNAHIIIVEGTPGKTVETIKRLVAEQLANGVKAGILASEETAGNYTEGIVIETGERENAETVASGLFASLRKCDEFGADIVYAEAYRTNGIGAAIMNRLLKAAGYTVIKAED